MLAFASAIAVLGATQAACNPGPGGPLTVTAQEDVLGLTSRLVFSTLKTTATDPRFVTLQNTGSSPISVTGLTIGGINPSQFKLAAGQPTSFTIQPDATAKVGARFTPTSVGNKFATLTIANNSSTGNHVVSLRGVSARGTQGNTEPQLAALVDLFGYSTDVGFTGVNQASTRAPLGDEISAPYWVRADASKPVQMIPIARYVQANLNPIDNGRTTKFSGGRQTLYRFPPDEQLDDIPDDAVDNAIYTENQKTFPKIYSGTTSFNPTAAFGLYGNFNNYSDDAFNRQIDSETLEPTTPPVYYHNVRVYPAKGSGGAVIPNAYILAVDVKVTIDKNFDHQDQVMLLLNAKPEASPGPAIGSASTVLPFTSSIAGTERDKDGEGTGFFSTQVNKNGTEEKPSLIDLTGGTVRITSTVGKNSGAENLQDNALQVAYDGSRTDAFVQTRLLGSLSDLSSGYQQKAVYMGQDQDTYLKIEAEHRVDKNGVFITVLREQNGATATVGQVKVANPAAVATLDLALSADLESGAIQAKYRINSDGAWTNLGPLYYPTQVMRFFNPQSRAGILVSHTGSTTPIVGVYDSFSVTAS
jgi:hypothetical protein